MTHVPTAQQLKTHRKCRSYFIVLKNDIKKMATIKYLNCGRTDCQSCQREKAEKYHREWEKRGVSVMYWKEVTDDEAKSLSLKARRSGNYYWRCPVQNGNTIIVTTYSGKACQRCGFPDWGGELIEPTDDVKELLREWVSQQRADSNISSSYKAVKEPKQWEKVKTLKSSQRGELCTMAEYMGWKEVRNGLFVGADVDDFVLAVEAVV